MTTTPHGQVPEALTYERDRAIMEGERNASLDAYSRVVLLTSAESRLYEAAFTNGWNRCAAHVQKPAENEHVAGDVSKNGVKVNMSTPQPVAQQGAASEPTPPKGEELRALSDRYWGREDLRDAHAAGVACGFALGVRALRTQQPAPATQQEVGNSGFDHKTAADFLSGKTVSDEALRKFVAASRGAHDDRAALRAQMLSLRGQLASREAEIALLKRSLLDAEAAAPQPSPTAQAAPALTQGAAIAAGAVYAELPDDVIDYVKGSYAFLQSTAPDGYAEEVFRLPPSATRNQRSLQDALQSDKRGWHPAAARQDSGDGKRSGPDAGVSASHGQAPAGATPYPMAGDEDESDLGNWQDGATKPTMDGTYLREFDEGLATSGEFYGGKWLRHRHSHSRTGRQGMTPKETHEQVQVGWLVVGEDGIGRFWPVDEKPEAMTYCEEAAEPAPVFCDKAALEKHNAEQEGKSHDN